MLMDIAYAKRWCAQHKYIGNFYAFDIYDFVKNELDVYIEGYVGGELFRYMMIKHMALVEDMGGFADTGRRGAALRNRCFQDSLNRRRSLFEDGYHLYGASGMVPQKPCSA